MLGFFVHNNPEAETQRSYAHVASNYKTERENGCVTPLGFCLKFIVNEKPLKRRHLVSFLLFKLIYV